MASWAGINVFAAARVEYCEISGEISVVSLLKIAAVSDETEGYEQLFTKKEYGSIQEIIDERNRKYSG